MGKKLLKKVLIFVAALFFIIYFCIQVKNIFIDSMETEYAALATFDETVEMKCYIIRDETLVHSSAGGTYNYVISEGEKLAEGQTITNVYSTDSEYRTQEQIREINDRISVLEDSSVESNYFTLNVTKIDKDIASSFTEYKTQLLSGELSLAVQNKKDLITTLNKRYLVINALKGFNDVIDEYRLEKDKLMSQITQNGESVYAPASGSFYSDVDGYETILTPSLLNSESVEEIITAIEGKPNAVPNTVVGKIVSEFEWYTVCVVDKDTSMLFSSGEYYDVAYPYSLGTTLKSLLSKKIVQSDSDKVVLVFQSSANTDSFNFMRTQMIEVRLDSHSGLRINKEALRIVDGVEGVFILNGNTVEFKRADKVYENDGYYIISPNDPNPDEKNVYSYLQMYDAVINNGIDLYHGKTIG